jgi:hypothetical protein
MPSVGNPERNLPAGLPCGFRIRHLERASPQARAWRGGVSDCQGLVHLDPPISVEPYTPARDPFDLGFCPEPAGIPASLSGSHIASCAEGPNHGLDVAVSTGSCRPLSFHVSWSALDTSGPDAAQN